MSPELDELLCKTFPNTYRDRHGDMKSTCMVWGFEFSNGWFLLTWDMSKKLEALILAVPEAERADYKMVQAKEKLGSARFYCNGTDEMYAICSEAEERSAVTCEYCGLNGVLRTGGWLLTLCEEHWSDEKARRAKLMESAPQL